jgi:hypothetical protein
MGKEMTKTEFHEHVDDFYSIFVLSRKLSTIFGIFERICEHVVVNLWWGETAKCSLNMNRYLLVDSSIINEYLKYDHDTVKRPSDSNIVVWLGDANLRLMMTTMEVKM